VTETTTSTVWFVRHAEAGERGRWHGPDRERPLDKVGRRQAEQLVDLLSAHSARRARRVLSSPYPRCRQTVEPLATALGLPVEDDEALAEGAPLNATLRLIAGCGDAVMCTHGDVMGNVVERLHLLGVVGDREPVWPKGCTWVLRPVDGEIVGAEYLAAPSG
jgi:8-oxo-(d)GTP phosphatase